MSSHFPSLAHLEALQPVPHGGAEQLVAAGYDPRTLVDFSATTLPIPPPAAVLQALSSAPLTAYPDPACTTLQAALGAHHGVPADHILCANGSVALIHAVARCCLAPGDTALIVGPTFGEYQLAISLTGARAVEVVATTAAEVLAAVAVHQPRLLFLCNPNNPTGLRWSGADLARIRQAVFVVLDEAYAGFLRPPPPPSWSRSQLVLRSLTKDRGLAGLRLGYAVAPPDVLRPLSVLLTPWGVNDIAQRAALAALSCRADYEAAIDRMWAERARLIAAIQELGISVTAGEAPFFLIAVGRASWVCAALLEQGVMVRDCSSFGLSTQARISPRTPADGDRLLAALRSVLPIINEEVHAEE